MLVGVTGTIGSGKSYVAGKLAELLSAQLISADQICRNLLKKDRPGYQAFVRRFAERFFGPDRDIDRTMLREAVFKDPRIREELEQILHPLVRQQIVQARENLRPEAFLVAEIPLLYESGWQNDFDYIICVAVSRSLAIDRVVSRDAVSREEVERIIDIQMDSEEKCRLADWVIDNNHPVAQTDAQIEAVGRAMLKSGGGPAIS